MKPSFDISLQTFESTRVRIAPYVRHTPLLSPPIVHGDVPVSLRLKLENLQVSGSFKARGVFNTLLQLNEQQRSRGVITASGGNHGVALALAAHRLGLPAIVYLPAGASEDRVVRIARWGATVLKHGAAWDDANQQALEHAEAERLTYVHPFDAERTLEGQGTLGLEILEDVPELDCILIAIGGGGLIAGMASAIKQRKPAVRIIGVEPVGSASMLHSLKAGRLLGLEGVHTIAETLAPRMVCERTLELTKRYVDEIVLVTDQQMVEAMRWLWIECNQLVEPAGAAVIAALLNGTAKIEPFRHSVALICGGNAAAESVFASYQQAAEALSENEK